jgi:hypothetical protein
LARIAASAGGPFRNRFFRSGLSRNGLLRGDRLDAGETDLAAVLQAKAARIDDGRDAALALRLKVAACGGSRSGAGKEHHCAERDRRPPRE